MQRTFEGVHGPVAVVADDETGDGADGADVVGLQDAVVEDGVGGPAMRRQAPLHLEGHRNHHTGHRELKQDVDMAMRVAFLMNLGPTDSQA
ncbi:MAG: hypothetical protein V2A73_22020 [Pseudomonadota bacterium]